MPQNHIETINEALFEADWDEELSARIAETTTTPEEVEFIVQCSHEPGNAQKEKLLTEVRSSINAECSLEPFMKNRIRLGIKQK